MATRRVTAGRKHLAGWKGVEGSGSTALDPLDNDHSYHVDLLAITQLGYIVSISGKIGNYQVRLLPMRISPYRVEPGTALSYCGADLGAILAAASYEADLVATIPGDAILAEEEVLRWVQS